MAGIFGPVVTDPLAHLTPNYLDRFGGIARLYGQEALAAFSRSRVVVVGIGGVGSWVAEALARSGIGALDLIDLDDLCITNTNRQLHALSDTFGQSKAEVLAQRLLQINPELTVRPLVQFYTENSADELLADSPSMVVDAIDSIKPKCHLLATCRRRGLAVVSSGGAGGRVDVSRIQMADLSVTSGDALLRSVRRKLRSEYDFPNTTGKNGRFRIQAVFSDEQPRFPQCDGSVGANRPAELDRALKCDAGFGAATHITATFANFLSGGVLSTLAKRAQNNVENR